MSAETKKEIRPFYCYAQEDKALRDELDFVQHWIYDRIHNGTIQISKDQETHLYLFRMSLRPSTSSSSCS